MTLLHRKIDRKQGRNAANNTSEKKLSHSNVSPKEQLLSHANLKVVNVALPQKQLHVGRQSNKIDIFVGKIDCTARMLSSW